MERCRAEALVYIPFNPTSRLPSSNGLARCLLEPGHDGPHKPDMALDPVCGELSWRVTRRGPLCSGPSYE